MDSESFCDEEGYLFYVGGVVSFSPVARFTGDYPVAGIMDL